MPKSLISYSVEKSRNMIQGVPQNLFLNLLGAFFFKWIVSFDFVLGHKIKEICKKKIDIRCESVLATCFLTPTLDTGLKLWNTETGNKKSIFLKYSLQMFSNLTAVWLSDQGAQYL